jgi:geranylgeranyl reductase family protein
LTGSRDAQVLIVGAGPAGASAAIELARAGRTVLLIDKARFPRDKCCGDGLTTGALRRLEHLGLDPRALSSFTPVHELALRSSNGRSARVDLGNEDGIPAAVARRVDLDRALVDLAREAGVEVREGLQARAVECNGASVHVLAGDESLEADYLLAADGAWSSIRRFLDADDGLTRAEAVGEWYAFRTYVRDVAPSRRDAMWIWFEKEHLPGYSWAFPVGPTSMNIGLFLKRSAHESGTSLKRAWQEMLASPFLSSLLGPRAQAEGPAKAWPIPADLRSAPLTDESGRVLYIGDAARVADPFSGEGIAQGIETGMLAARSLVAYGERPQLVAAHYRSAVQHSLGREQRVSRAASRAMSVARLQNAAVLASSSPSVGRQIGRFLFEDYERAAVLDPRRWQDLRRAQRAPFSARA